MSDRLKAGDRVEFVDWPREPHPRAKELVGRTARVVRVDHPRFGPPEDWRVHVIWDDPVPDYIIVNYGARYPYTVREVRLRRIAANIVTPAPVTRGGYKVTGVYSTGDADRPFGALIHLPGGTRKMTFSKEGHFYKSVQLPVDLVNAC